MKTRYKPHFKSNRLSVFASLAVFIQHKDPAVSIHGADFCLCTHHKPKHKPEPDFSECLWVQSPGLIEANTIGVCWSLWNMWRTWCVSTLWGRIFSLRFFDSWFILFIYWVLFEIKNFDFFCTYLECNNFFFDKPINSNAIQ